MRRPTLALLLAAVALVGGWQVASAQAPPPVKPAAPPTAPPAPTPLDEALALCQRLGTHDSDVREQVVKAIGRRKGVKSWVVVLYLRWAEQDSTSAVRAAAQQALAAVGHPDSADELVAVVRSTPTDPPQTPDLRKIACLELARSFPKLPATRPLLEAALLDDDLDSFAAQGLKLMDDAAREAARLPFSAALGAAGTATKK